MTESWFLQKDVQDGLQLVSDGVEWAPSLEHEG